MGVENSGLYTGKLYTNDFKVYDEKHQFLNTSELLKGSVTYDNQTFYDQRLKYDVFNDELLISPKGISSSLLVVLEKRKVKRFSVDNKRFIRIDENSQESNILLGFCEVLAQKGTSSLLKKIKKIEGTRRVNNLAYSEFKDKINYYVWYDGACLEVDSKRDWLSIFPEYQEQIKEYYNTYSALKKSDKDSFMKLAFERVVPSEKTKMIVFDED